MFFVVFVLHFYVGLRLTFVFSLAFGPVWCLVQLFSRLCVRVWSQPNHTAKGAAAAEKLHIRARLSLFAREVNAVVCVAGFVVDMHGQHGKWGQGAR